MCADLRCGRRSPWKPVHPSIEAEPLAPQTDFRADTASTRTSFFRKSDFRYIEQAQSESAAWPLGHSWSLIRNRLHG